MKLSLGRYFSRPAGGWSTLLPEFLRPFARLFRMDSPEPRQVMRRLEVERDIVLPVKAAGIAMLLYSFYFSPWIGNVLGALEIAVESVQYLLWVYIAVNAVFAAVLVAMRRVPTWLLQWVVFVSSLVDGIFVSAVTLVTGGYDSILYWLFIGLIVRSAVTVPRGTSQLTLDFALIACYTLSGLVDIAISELADYLDEEVRMALGFAGPVVSPAEPLILRLLLLVLVAVCSYAVQVLAEHQRQAEEEAREFAAREGQLHSAGRLAAEFAHQVKNPLAIINNAAFSVQRALQNGRHDVSEQIEIIQEEVGRADRIITDVMGYAQLSEGRVEKLNLVEELDHAIERVFPPGAGFPVAVRREYEGVIPPLWMQRRHLLDLLINVLQNAREALYADSGNVTVHARCQGDQAIEVIIQDDGRGIPKDKQERIFEPYYTTKQKGTGLGLATVKHNVELYGGTVQVQSELGKGTRFIIVFPSRTLT